MTNEEAAGSGDVEDSATHLAVARDWSRRSFHPWFAVRAQEHALAAVSLTLMPSLADMTGIDTALQTSNFEEIRATLASREHSGDVPRLVDMCSGTGTIATSAAILGCDVVSIEIQPVPAAINRLLNYFGANPRLALPRKHSKWDGLSDEIGSIAGRVQSRLAAARGERIDAGSDSLVATIWALIAECPHCSSLVPLVDNFRITKKMSFDFNLNETSACDVFVSECDGPPPAPTYWRGQLSCRKCGRKSKVDTGVVDRARPLVDVLRNSEGQITAAPSCKADLDFSAPDYFRAGSEESCYQTGDLDAAWTWEPRTLKPIPLRRAHLPSQLKYLNDATDAVLKELAALTLRSGLPDDAHRAIFAAMGLLLSALLPDVSTFSTWDSLRGLPTSGTRTHKWFSGPVFCESGPVVLQQRWSVALARLQSSLVFNSEYMLLPSKAMTGDAADSGLPAQYADYIIWDPPFYDNIDYSSLARPHEILLSKFDQMIARVFKISVFDDVLLGAPRHDYSGRDNYERQLVAQANEARRLLKPGSTLGVFWFSRASSDLQKFLNMVAPCGLNLVRAVRLLDIQPTLSGDVGSYLLVLTSVPDVEVSSHSAVDASRLLELADVNAPSLYEALADFLLDYWDSDDLAQYIPSHFRGSARSRLAELVASQSDPGYFLSELGRPILREAVRRRGLMSNPESSDARSLAEILLSHFGFDIPEQIGFSISTALSIASAADQRLLLSGDKEAVAGSFQTIAIEIERTLRFSVISWAQVYGPEWQKLLDELTAVSGNKPARRKSLSFGDWKSLFIELPKRLQDLNLNAETFGGVASSMRKAKIDEKLSKFIRMRNQLVHDSEDLEAATLVDLGRRAHDCSSRVIEALRALETDRKLPVTLLPSEEIRDRFGRRRLILVDAVQKRTEVFVDKAWDLTRPVVYLASGNNPRDTAAVFFESREIAELMKL